MKISPLKPISRFWLILLSFFLVAFGQPAWQWWMGLIAAVCGFALFWRVLLDIPHRWERFIMAMGWFAGVQVVQLSWMMSHPYLYIYGVLLFCAWLMGAQFGVIALFIRPRLFQCWGQMFAVAALWTVMEWSRLFFLSGLSFNPVGIELTGSTYPLHFASLGGVYLLSFWVMLTNSFALKAWVSRFSGRSLYLAILIALVPYLFGGLHFYIHEKALAQTDQKVNVVLIQTAAPVENRIELNTPEETYWYVMGEWSRILAMMKEHKDASIDLIALPEYFVLYGTYQPVFPLKSVKALFKEVFGQSRLEALPPLEEPYALFLETGQGMHWFVSNAFFAQALANLFQADVVIGLQDDEWIEDLKRKSYSSAFHFSPGNQMASRYDKRVLVPMGEYIPFTFCREIAAQYGIGGSFTCGEQAKVFQGKLPMSPSICYEETYGHLMREGRLLGAQMMVNLTNDGWFPNSRLPRQHFDHARLRTVENGIPLVRSCNTGVTAGLDSLGRTVKVLSEDPLKSQWTSGALYVEVSTYHYQTLYAKLGDWLIIGFCLAVLMINAAIWLTHLTHKK